MRIVFLLATLMWLTTAQLAMAGSVDAPYVHVDWGNGRVHVCAPFVDLYVDRPFCCAPPACADGHASNDARPAPATAEQARRQLGDSSSELYDSLGRFKTADKWRHFLAVAPEEPLASDQLYHINSAVAAKLKTVLENFDSAAADEQYKMISSLPEFQRTRGLLADYLARIGNVQGVEQVSAKSAVDSPLARSPRWSPASTQPQVGLPGPGVRARYRPSIGGRAADAHGEGQLAFATTRRGGSLADGARLLADRRWPGA